jgi:hypothetical protein
VVFREKLDILIEIFCDNSSKLARAINVDPSLISKWRSGVRNISPTSVHACLIAEYFAKKESMQYQKDALHNILKVHNPDIDINNHEELKNNLLEWLFTNNDQIDTNTRHDNSFKKNNVSGLKSILSSKVPSSMLDINTLMINGPGTPKGELVYSNIYKGNDGKRKAILNIIQTMLTSHIPLECTFYDDTDIEWLIEDKEFILIIKQLVRRLAEAGHRITVFNHLSRDLTQTMRISSFWLPFYTCCNINFLYFPKYYTPLLNKTLCHVKNTIVMFSMNISTMAQTQTVLSTGPFIGEFAEEMFKASLTRCKPLGKLYSNKKITEFMNEVVKAEELPGSQYKMINCPSIITMPQYLYSKMLDKVTLTSYEKETRLEIYTKRINAFNKNIRDHKYMELINLNIMDIPEHTESRQVFTYKSLEFFSCNTLSCNTLSCDFTDFADHLSNVVRLLKEYDNYEAILVNMENIKENDFSIQVQENSCAIISSYTSNEDDPAASIIHENTIVESIKYYILESVDLIPINKRSKDYTIIELEKLILKLQTSTL